MIPCGLTRDLFLFIYNQQQMKNKLFLASVLAFIMISSYGQKSYYFQTKDGAISGYDPVAYFTQKKPTKGTKEHSLVWMDATWYFSNEQNMTTFRDDPEKYAPQFGGYCAYAVAKGYTTKVDPTAWKIVDGKLYLSYNKSVRVNWEKSIKRYIKSAESNWPGLAGLE